MTTPGDQVRLAEAYLEGGDPLQAVAVLEPVLEEYGNESAVASLLARAYFHSAQLARAASTLVALVALVAREPSDTYARFLLARTLERQSAPKRAVGHLRVVVAMSDNADARDRLAHLERRHRLSPPTDTDDVDRQGPAGGQSW